MAKSDELVETTDPAERLFHDTATRFTIFSGLRAGLLSGIVRFGYHGRLTRHRVHRLQNSVNAKQLRAGLSQLTDQQSAHFRGLAAVNKEQADAAFRYTAIINFTAPITLIVVVNQLNPDFFAEFFSAFGDREFGWVRLFVVIALSLFAGVGPLLHAYVSVSNARDIHHLALIDGARRGAPSGAGPDDGDALLDPTDL